MKNSQRTALSEEKLKDLDEYRSQFIEAVSNDLQMPQAVATMWKMLKSNIPSPDKLDLLLEFDKVLGLKLSNVKEEKLPEKVERLRETHEQAKSQGNFSTSDKIREKLDKLGYGTIETTAGTAVVKKRQD